MKSIIPFINKEMRTPGLCLFAIAALLAITFTLGGCGGGSSNTNSSGNTLTGLKKRVLLSNEFAGTVTIMDALKDQLSTATPLSAPGATKMVTAGGFTAVIDATINEYNVINNAMEQGVQAPQTLDRVTDIATDGKIAYAAVRNVGQVVLVNISSGAVKSVNIPSPARLVLSPNGTKLLVFPDDPQALVGGDPNSFFVVDTASLNLTQIGSVEAGSCTTCLDQPFTAVFNGSETQAFILNCGAECGGTNASVVKVDFSGATPTFSAPIPVSAATVGLLNGSNLFVAGTPPGSATGTLQVINTGSLTASAPTSITDGHHLKMQMASNNRLYIASVACTPSNDPSTGLVRGCLSIFNTGTNSVVVPEVSGLRSNFDVTGIQPITNRTVVYVCEGGELDIYDTNTDKLTPNQIDIQGQAIDVVQIDP
jgi:hypothetical protein